MTELLDRLAPGLYQMSADQYHADPVPGGSLSSSGARRLLACPAKFRWEQQHPAAPKKEFDLGHAAHKLVLGAGPELVRIDAERWDTKDTKAKVADVRARGAVPLKPDAYKAVHDMADAIRRHPVASALFDPSRGRPEQALIWQDEATGVMRRALVDWLPNQGPGRMIVADYKTTISADPAAIRKTVANYGYHCQQPWYTDGIEALGLADDPAFVFAFQEKTEPYLITIVQIDPDDVDEGRRFNRQAIELYAECATADHWPGYSDGIELIKLPPWAANRSLQEAW